MTINPIASELTSISKKVHSNNVEKGFYEETPSVDRSLMLIVGECSEAHEAYRKGRRAESEFVESTKEDIQIDKNNFETYVKDSLEDEVADVIIRCLDFCGFHDIDIGHHINMKLAYNRERPHKHGKRF
jgi:NTP pyrophosphatase (non-canonical NTP hydrolase)